MNIFYIYILYVLDNSKRQIKKSYNKKNVYKEIRNIFLI